MSVSNGLEEQIRKGTSTPWMNANDLLKFLEEHKVAHPMAFGYDVVKLMRWIAVQKMVIQSPYRDVKYIIKSKKPVRREPNDPRRDIALFKVVIKKVDPLIPPKKRDF